MGNGHKFVTGEENGGKVETVDDPFEVKVYNEDESITRKIMIEKSNLLSCSAATATTIVIIVTIFLLIISALIVVAKFYLEMKKGSQVSVVENPLYNTGESESYDGETMMETKNTYYDGDDYYGDSKNYVSDTNATYS